MEQAAKAEGRQKHHKLHGRFQRCFGLELRRRAIAIERASGAWGRGRTFDQMWRCIRVIIDAVFLPGTRVTRQSQRLNYGRDQYLSSSNDCFRVPDDLDGLLVGSFAE